MWGLPFAPLLFTPASGRGLALSELCATALMSRRVLRCLEGGPRAPELRPGQIRPDLLQLVWRKQRWGKELGVGSAGRGRVRRALRVSRLKQAPCCLCLRVRTVQFLQPKRCGWSLRGQPGAASSRVEAGEARQARAGAETQRFFWKLAEAGVEAGGSEKPVAPETKGEGCGGGEGTGSPRPDEGGGPQVWVG